MIRPSLRRAAPLLLALSLPILSLGGCSVINAINPWSGPSTDTQTKEDPSTVPVEELYNRGVDALNEHRYDTAATQFDQVEQYYPYSTWAVNAQLMQGYAEYLESHYTDAIGTLDRFIQLHPAHRDIGYAYYLRALCYYEQIADIERDQKGTEQAMNALREVVNRFPDTAYANDARLKIDLCVDHLAGKEMEIGRYYMNKRDFIGAINRFKVVVTQYQTTRHVEEALMRLSEAYVSLGIMDEAQTAAAVLGHNFPDSPWYKDAYNLLKGQGREPNENKDSWISRSFKKIGGVG